MKLLIVFIFISTLSACTKGYQHFELVEENLNTYLSVKPKEPIYKNIIHKEKDDVCSFDFIETYSKTKRKSFTNCIQREEIQYIKSINDGNWPARLGLALSGGGTRSASFSIGVLKALQETGHLKDVDIISSVSGGSYASYWFYSQLFYKDKIQHQLENKIDEKNKKINDENAKVIPDKNIIKPLKIEKEALINIKDKLNYSRDDLFRSWNDPNKNIKPTNLEDPNKFRFQRMLEESSDILAYTHKPSFWNDFTIGIQYAFQTVYQSFTIPFHWVSGGFFDWEVNMTPFFYFYKDGLERTYGYVPLDYSLEHFANSKSNSIKGKVDANPILLHEMSVFLNGCDFRRITVNNDKEIKNKKSEFFSEFENKKNECAILILDLVNTINGLSISFFNKDGEPITKYINNLSDKLSIALGEKFINKSEVIKLVAEKYDFPLRNKIPSFIINATARYGAEYGEYERVGGRTMENSVFEFTPWGCYSPLLYEEKVKDKAKTIGVKKNGITDNCPEDLRYNSPRGYQDLDLARIVSISGAAVDGQVEFVDIGGDVEDSFTFWGKSWLDIALDISNLNMGYHVINPNSNFWNNLGHKFLPWPLYLVHDASSKESPTSLYLTDGGFSDNLGLLPLIRRGVENIIVVDAEQDGKSIFESAKRLNKTLTKYKLQLLFKNNKKPLTVQDTAIKDAVIFGNIVDKHNNKIIKIIYVKLAAPSRHTHGNTVHDEKQLPFSVRSYLEKNPGFPHQSTADVFYSADQFRAYRDLGYIITETCFKKEGGRCHDFYKTP